MGTYRDLVVWQRAIDLSVEVYSLTRSFPTDERFGLTSQMRRAGVSVASNIAEGHGRDTAGSFAHFLSIAQGSLKELETQTIIAERVGYIDRDVAEAIGSRYAEVGRLLRPLIVHARNRANPRTTN